MRRQIVSVILGATLIVGVASVASAVPRDIVVHLDGTKVEGQIIEENAQTIILRTEKYGTLHFRKADLAQLVRGFDPDAPQTTTVQETAPSYDYRVYIPRGPVDPERPAQPIIIAELIRRGLTPPPLTPAPGSAVATPSAPPREAQSEAVRETPMPTPLSAATVVASTPEVRAVTPLPSPTVAWAPPQTPTATSTAAMPTPMATAALPVSETPVAARTVASPVSAPAIGISTQATPVAAAAPATPIPATKDALLAMLLPSPQPVPTASSAGYVGGQASAPAPPNVAPAGGSGETVGSVGLVQGTTQRRRGAETVAAAAGTPVAVGDVFETGGDGMVALRFGNGIIAVLGINTMATVLKGGNTNTPELGVAKGSVWIVGEAGAGAAVVPTVAAAGCGVTPDPSDLSKGVGLKVALVEGGRLLIASQRGRLILADSVTDSTVSVDAGKPVVYLPGSRKFEDAGPAGDVVSQEWGTVQELAKRVNAP
jgi:hypothetical protein